MNTRTPLVAGNWKMHKTAAEAAEYCAQLRAEVGDVSGVQIAICPPFTALESSAAALAGSTIQVMAQAVHEASSGAHTGEISGVMIAATGATGTLVGHSERRAAGETDAQVAARVRAGLDAGLFVIMCCGESLEQRDAGETLTWLEGQVEAGLAQVSPDEQERIAVAYEPIWAIGTGRTASPEQAQEACAHVRAVAGRRFDAAALRVLYGGSVNEANAAELMAQPDVDGGLVGGASLKADTFAQIVRAAL
jgi:triosephosphate isomerase